MLSLAFIAFLITALLLFTLQNVALWGMVQASQGEAQILRQQIQAERTRNDDLLDANYQLARLNEELFVALDDRHPLITPLPAAVYWN